MTISEACKFEIEDSVDTACDKSGISKTEAFQALEKFYNSIGVKITFSGRCLPGFVRKVGNFM